MRFGKFYIEISKFINDNPIWYPQVRHKYWYQWDLYLNFGKRCYSIELCRTDWNKCYKESCANYTIKCKHNIECNNCMDCYKEK